MFTPATGSVYKFKFLSGFDPLNGIYEVTQILTYEEVLSAGIELSEIYTKVGKPQSEFEASSAQFRTDKIYKLKYTDRDEFIHVPSSLVAEVPNSSVSKYYNLALAINLGTFADPDKITWLKNYVTQLISAELGIESPADMFSVSSVYLTDDEYAIIETDRAMYAGSVTNHYSELKKLEKMLLEKQSKIEALETIVRLQNEKLNP